MVRPGLVLAERFVLEAVLGSGGMGRVLRAFDRQTGRVVAVKLLLAAEVAPAAGARFAAEIAALAELSHPGIVGYVAHGTTDEGSPFLAMEYLEGEDLRARLARRPLTLAESLALARRTAEALAEAHRHGIVHRDLKPSNLFLRGGSPERPVLVDFGIARRPGLGRGLTATGAAIGTPEYMAPEQAQGLADVGPAADVFSLGCVLFECLAGRPPWTGDHVIATLAKIVFEEAPSLDELRPDLPPAVGALVARMLAKAPAARPRDAGVLCDALASLDVDASVAGAAEGAPAVGLGARELELVSVLLAVHASPPAADATLDAGAVLESNRAADALRRELATGAGEVERLADGSIVATLPQRGESAADLALEAALCAKIVRSHWPEAVVSVATARRVAGAPVPVGEALDRVARVLTRVDPTTEGAAPRILLDDVTAGLLQGRLQTAEIGRGVVTLHEGSGIVDASRPLLGKPTPCVGRERELATLEGAVASAIDDGEARAVLVTAGPGLGKSRLRHELLRRVARRREGGEPGPIVLLGRGELIRASSPHGVLGGALRGAFGLSAEDAPEAARAKLLEGVARHVGAAAALEVAELVGEVAGVPFPDDDRPRLRAARQDPRILQTRIGDAFVTWLRRACEATGVVLVLEDLHWGDRGSVDLVLRALRELEDARLAVVAFARPEIHEAFPGLWKGRADELPLRPLGAKACQRLVAEVAGDRLAPATVARIVEQSAGNALFLEELVRAACAGEETLPETVLAMLQSRIGRLDAPARRVLRAASVLGEAFDPAGVLAVLGPPAEREDVDRRLAALVRDEVLTERRDDHDASGFRFRHALMRDAAYGLLPEEERRVGHRLAAEWLLARGDADPAIVGGHLADAGDTDRAAPWLARAAERALAVDDLAAVARLTGRGRAFAAGPDLAALLAFAAMAESMRWRWRESRVLAEQAIALVPEGTATWCRAARQIAGAAAFANDLATQAAIAERYVLVEPEEGARLAYADSAMHIASPTSQTGFTAVARALLRRAEEVVPDLADRPALLAWHRIVLCTVLRHSDDDLAAQIRAARAATAAYAACDAPRSMGVLANDVLGELLCRAGFGEEGEGVLRASFADAKRAGLSYVASHASLALANGLLSRGGEARVAEVEELARGMLATPDITVGYQAMARDVLGVVHARRGELGPAEEQLRAAIALSPHTPVRRWLMAARLADVLVAAGRGGEAARVADEALVELDLASARGEGGGYAELPLVVAAARAAIAAGDAHRARSLAARATAYAAARRAAFADEADRAAYDGSPAAASARALDASLAIVP
jgi:hypothetical protein